MLSDTIKSRIVSKIGQEITIADAALETAWEQREGVDIAIKVSLKPTKDGIQHSTLVKFHVYPEYKNESVDLIDPKQIPMFT